MHVGRMSGNEFCARWPRGPCGQQRGVLAARAAGASAGPLPDGSPAAGGASAAADAPSSQDGPRPPRAPASFDDPEGGPLEEKGPSPEGGGRVREGGRPGLTPQRPAHSRSLKFTAAP
eukprot:8041470-Pyramimonas_sp.AAC.1